MYLFVNAWFPFWLAGEVPTTDRYTVVDWVEHTAARHEGYPGAMAVTAFRVARRPRDFVGVRGPDAGPTSRRWSRTTSKRSDRRLVRGASPDAEGASRSRRSSCCDAAVDDFLLLTEPELGERVRATLLARASPRSARSCSRSTVLVVARRRRRDSDGGLRRAGGRGSGRRSPRRRWTTRSSSSCGSGRGRLVSVARSTTASFPPRPGSTTRAVDFEKGCYPGQEPIARQHYRGRVNRTLRVLEIDGEELPEYDAELSSRGR